ncbi:MAG TPA: type II secretion system F family protein [Gemmatimonadaceae bacterium]
MAELLTLALVFLGTIGLLVGTWTFLNRSSLTASDAALERLREVEQAQDAARNILRDESVSALPTLDRLLGGREITGRLTLKLQSAGVEMTPGSFVLGMGISAFLMMLVGRVLTGSIFGAAIGTGIGLVLPVFWLGMKENARLMQFQDQLPEAIDMLVSAMKAGYSFQAAMKFIGEEVPGPLGPEFARFYEEQRLGMEVRTALLAMQERVNSLDLRMFVTAILIQRETGGNLSEVLGKIATLMRERAALKGEIRTLTAESKLSARILGALPFVVFGMVNLLNPGFMRPMMATSYGPWVFFGATLSVGMGYWIMMQIADIEI